MGRGLKDIAHVENMPYDFQDTPGMVRLNTAAGVKSPVEVSAEILATLRQRAEDALKGKQDMDASEVEQLEALVRFSVAQLGVKRRRR